MKKQDLRGEWVVRMTFPFVIRLYCCCTVGAVIRWAVGRGSGFLKRYKKTDDFDRLNYSSFVIILSIREYLLYGVFHRLECHTIGAYRSRMAVSYHQYVNLHYELETGKAELTRSKINFLKLVKTIRHSLVFKLC